MNVGIKVESSMYWGFVESDSVKITSKIPQSRKFDALTDALAIRNKINNGRFEDESFLYKVKVKLWIKKFTNKAV